jgi:hypothetical protein
MKKKEERMKKKEERMKKKEERMKKKEERIRAYFPQVFQYNQVQSNGDLFHVF